MRGEIDYMMETDGGAESERLWREAHVRCTTLETDASRCRPVRTLVIALRHLRWVFRFQNRSFSGLVYRSVNKCV